MMNWISRNNILIVGLGLMGGSYAKALKRLGFKVEAIDSRPESIRFAEENGLIPSIRRSSRTGSASISSCSNTGC